MSLDWTIGIDIGGTFTDIVAVNKRQKQIRMAKVLTVASNVSAGLVDAISAVGLTWPDIGCLVHGTTMVTNAIVEDRLEDIALITTEGFTDVLKIARQNRQALYRLDTLPRNPPQVSRDRCVGVRERIGPQGQVLRELDRKSVSDAVAFVKASGVRAAAISLLHSYANPVHEAALASELSSVTPYVSMSHEINPETREYERTVATTLNAALMPTTADYIERLTQQVPRSCNLYFFHSAGGMSTPLAVREHPLSLALSGPAAGVAAASKLASALKIEQAITFDMGGTTTDVCLIMRGNAEIARHRRLAGRPLRQPMVAVESIGAGGGSIIELGSGGLTVGPQSAGSSPGPACYGLGGVRPTITDANVILGYLTANNSLGGKISVDADLARKSLQPIADRLGVNINDAALGVVKVANAAMARALRRVTVERGVDPRISTLIAFGGAGPMHAIGVAREIGISRIIVPGFSSGFSALGCVTADLSLTQQQTLRLSRKKWDQEKFERYRGGLVERVEAPLIESGRKREEIVLNEVALIRYAGQSYSVEVPYAAPLDLTALDRDFKKIHESLYGYSTSEPWEIESLRISARVASEAIEDVWTRATENHSLKPTSIVKCVFDGGDLVDTPRLNRTMLPTQTEIIGPAIIEDSWSTTIVPPEVVAHVDEQGHLHLAL